VDADAVDADAVDADVVDAVRACISGTVAASVAAAGAEPDKFGVPDDGDW